jgi:hypothetical protein
MQNAGYQSDFLASINKKYNLHLPYLGYDKIIDHVCAKHKKLRISTYDRYVTHLGIFGTNNAKTENFTEPLHHII